MGVGMAGAHDFDATTEDSDATDEQHSLGVVHDDPAVEIDLRFGDPTVALGGVGAVAAETPQGILPDITYPAAEPATSDSSISKEAEAGPAKEWSSELLERIAARRRAGRDPSLVYLGLKRMVDLLVSGLLLLLLLPVYVVVAVVVWSTSRGPALYRQEHVGRGGSTYMILKFRSMTVDADQRLDEMDELAAAGAVHPGSGPAFKAPDDPRVTKVGKIIRRTGLDELPQLFNIIGGSMSIIGPRPLVAKEVAELEPPDAELRHTVRPGVSCIWQVTRTSDMVFEDRIALDLLYVQRRSMTLDLALFMMTPIAIFRGEGTY